LASLPRLLRVPIAALLRALGQTRAAELLATARGRSTRDYWAAVAEREVFKAAFLDAWRSAGFDALLCPAMGVPAFLHGQSRDLTPACSATFLWNLLDVPCGVLPVTRVRADECAYDAPPGQRDAFAAAARVALAGAEGLPVGVQVVGLPWRDEEALEVMEELERALAAAPDAAEQAWRAEGGGVPPQTLRATLERAGAGRALSYLQGWAL
jgi:fatty acid amide hydrolase